MLIELKNNTMSQCFFLRAVEYLMSIAMRLMKYFRINITTESKSYRVLV
jgi:hypothetical protein